MPYDVREPYEELARLDAENAKLRELLERAMRMWIHTESELAKDINAALKE